MTTPDSIYYDLESMTRKPVDGLSAWNESVTLVFGSKNYLDLDLSTWSRDGEQNLNSILSDLIDPLHDVLADEIYDNLTENVAHVHTMAPGRLLTSNRSRIANLMPVTEDLKSIGDNSVRRIRLHTPKLITRLDPYKEPLFDHFSRQKNVVCLKPALAMFVPLEVTKLGVKELQDPILGSIIVTKLYSLSLTTSNQPGLEPWYRGQIILAYLEDKRIKSIKENDLYRRAQAWALEAWNMAHPYVGGSPDSSH